MTDGWWHNGYHVSYPLGRPEILLPRGLSEYQRGELRITYASDKFMIATHEAANEWCYWRADGQISLRQVMFGKFGVIVFSARPRHEISSFIDNNLEAIDPITAFSLEYGIGTASKGEQS